MNDTGTGRRGVFLDIATVSENDIDLDALAATLPDWTLLDATAPEQVQSAVGDASIVITNKSVLDRATIESAARLELICIAATGTNNVDLAAAAARNITVCNVRAYATASVVEHVFLLILALRRRLEEHCMSTRTGNWSRATRFSMLDFPFSELNGRTLGIIGYGELGQAVGRVAEAFGMQLLVAQRPGKTIDGRCPLDRLLAGSDVVTLHCPLTPDTRDLIDADALDRMKADALLINTARGGIVNEADLLAALQAGAIAGAALDVLCVEPPAADNPLLGYNGPGLILTPHVAWAGRDARQRLVDELVLNIRGFLAGTPRNVVTCH